MFVCLFSSVDRRHSTLLLVLVLEELKVYFIDLPCATANIIASTGRIIQTLACSTDRRNLYFRQFPMASWMIKLDCRGGLPILVVVLNELAFQTRLAIYTWSIQMADVLQDILVVFLEAFVR